MTTFTNDTSAAARTRGEVLLGYYWRESRLSKAPYTPIATNWQGLLGWLDTKYPTFINYLGTLGSQFDNNKLIEMMKYIAQNPVRGRETMYIIPADVANGLMREFGSGGDISAAVQAVGQTASEITGFSLSFLKWLGFASIAILLVYFYKTTPEVKKIVKGVTS